MRIERFTDVNSFLARASRWLMRREAENNVLLGIAQQLQQGVNPYEDPIYLATVEDVGQVVGCAYRTPPWKVGLTRIPVSGLPPLVRDLGQAYPSIPAVLGPERQAIEFAQLWTELYGGSWAVGMRQRIHVLDRAVELPCPVTGSLRLAQQSDGELVREWADGFARDTRAVAHSPHDLAQRLIDSRSLYLWEDVEPRAMAAAVGQTAQGVRVGYVYTPPEFRSRGYATSIVARLSQQLMDNGRAFCCLYTDLANETSNAIYARIGYRPECDVVDVQLSGPTT